MEQTNTLIALDADGVLVDYHAGYRLAWERAFGTRPEIIDPNAYSVFGRFGVEQLDPEKLDQLRAAMGDSFWASLPPLDGALEACLALKEGGFTLVRVSAIQEKFRDARAQNLADIGFPLQDVYAAPSKGTHSESPKAARLHSLMPVAFVDDYAPYLQGVSSSIHKALILREPNGSPNTGEALKLADSTHKNLLAFSKKWLSGMR